jgi:glycosyltransferase involved in cell wall biosynthesis
MINKSTGITLEDFRVSVIITSFNHKKYLIEALESVINQTLKPYEIIVADDSSTDGSVELIQDYINSYDGWIKGVFQEKNVGIPKNRNAALHQVKGNYVAILDGDDRFFPQKLQRELEALQKYPAASCVYSNLLFIDSNGQSLYIRDQEEQPSGDIFAYVAQGTFGLLRSMVIDYNLLQEVGFLDERFPKYDGFDLTVHLAKRSQFAYVQEPLVEKREYPSSDSKSLKAKEHLHDLEGIYKKMLPYLENLPVIQKKSITEQWVHRLSQLQISDSLEQDNTLESSIKIPLIYSFARSGATLINRCLGCIPGNIVLSEINPHASFIPIEVQARDWFNLLSPVDFPKFSNKTYAAKIRLLAEVVQQHGNHLIIRDWTTLNFLDRASNDVYTPTKILEQQLYLSRHNFDCRPIVLTRRAADVYESITRTFQHLRNLSIKEFGSCYLAYAKAVAKYPVFHYESFCREPEKELRRICDVLGVKYSDTFVTEFSKFTKCTGDNTLLQPSRGNYLERITVLESRQESESYIIASLDKNCLEADQLLGYETMEIEIEKQVDALWEIVDFRDQALKQTTDLKQQTQEELVRTQAQLQQTQAQLQQTQAQLQQTHAELTFSQTKIQQLDQQLKQANVEFQGVLEQSQGKIQQLDQQLKQANVEFQGVLEQSQGKIQQLDQQLKQANVEFQGVLEQSQGKIQQLDQQLKQANVEFQGVLEQSQGKIQQLDQQLKQANVEFQEALEQSQTQNQQTQVQLQQTQGQLQQTQAELEHSRKIIQTMESSKFWQAGMVWSRLKKAIMLSNDK